MEIGILARVETGILARVNIGQLEPQIIGNTFAIRLRAQAFEEGTVRADSRQARLRSKQWRGARNMTTRGEFLKGVLNRLGVTKATVGSRHRYKCMLALLAQSYAESGMEACDGVSGAAFNPLNTTYNLPPCSDFNSFGVKNYESIVQGEKATVDTFQLSYYTAIMDAFMNRKASLWDIGRAIANSEWGTGDLELSALKTLLANPLKLRRVRNLSVG